MKNLIAMMILSVCLTTKAHASLNNNRSIKTAGSVKEFLKECMKTHQQGWCIQLLAHDLLPDEGGNLKQVAELQSHEGASSAR